MAQEDAPPSFLAPADTFHKGRFWSAAGAGSLIYGGFAYGLYQSWYKDYELTGFHTFDDLREWQQMDKAGHIFTTHFESNLLYSGARWAGVPPKTARWTAVGAALWLQTTVEVMDGFSEKWGFSWSDMAANLAGAGLFVGQEYLWQEQRILLKVSSDIGKQYPEEILTTADGMHTTTLAERAASLYGSSFGERFIKDYNAQTIWASVNIRSFAGPANNWPAWLNVAFGYGSENMFGGFDNKWTDSDSGGLFRLSTADYPRYRQYYLSLDVDLSRIKTKSRLLRTFLRCINYVKIPAPALEINGLGQVKGHWLHW
ncbi:DUF2279 domain-containing protein [Flavilitoribacter nigricans]|nr:DUF2279 domain-containing protein [Flavilitoribacter nigricans]